MRRESSTPTLLLRRIAELTVELRRTRAQLKNLRVNDRETGAVVLRGARLAQERTLLERRLDAIRFAKATLSHTEDNRA